MIRVSISNDVNSVGDAATEVDLEQYRANLETRLGELFPGTQIYVVTESVDRCRVTGEPSDLLEQIEEWINEMPEVEFRKLVGDAPEYTLRDFVRAIPGGLIRTDRGSYGDAGPFYLGEGSDIDEDLDEIVTLVTEHQDPDAWRLAREAMEATIDGPAQNEPNLVAIGERDKVNNGAQVIYVG